MQRRITLKGPSDNPPGGFKDDHELATDGRAGIEVNLFEMMALLVRRKRLIAAVVSAVMGVTAVYTLALPNKYRSHATVLTTGKTDNMSILKNVAGLAGLAVGEGDPATQFPVILRSNLVRDAVIDMSHVVEDNGEKKSITLSDYFGHTNRDLLRHQLSAITTVTPDPKIGALKLAVETRSPQLSQAVLRGYIDELESYNMHQRRSQAGEHAGFLGRQAQSALAELEGAENELQKFQQNNRNWAVSTDPAMVTQLARYRRDVEAKSKVFMFLLQEYEAAKLRARQDMPIVCILDEPSLPVLKCGPNRTLTVLLSGIVSTVVILFLILVADALTSRGGRDQEGLRDLRNNIAEAFPRSTRLLAYLNQSRKRDTVHSEHV